jgi:hypothetical protein
VYDYYVATPEFADVIAGAVCDLPAKVKETMPAFADLGVDDISFNTRTDDIDDVKGLSDIVFCGSDWSP